MAAGAPLAPALAQALALHQAGRLAEAARGYERLLRARPGDARALALLGALRLQQGEARPAAKLLRQALALAPGDAAARYNLGLALLRLGEDADAEAAFRGVLAAQPGHGGALVNLGGLLNRQGGFVEAEALLRRALGARFDAALGARFDAALGARLEPGLGAQPGDALALNNLGACLHGQGRHAEAISPLRQALALRPDYALALENLGAALLAADQPAAAAEALDQAVALNAVPSGDLLGAALLARLRLHRWDGAAALLARALAAPAPPPEPLDLLYHPLPPATLRAQAAAQAAEVVARVAALPRPRRASRPPGRIRLGYVSGDLHEHATAWLVAETLERHDRAAFQVHAYATSPDDGGPMRRRLAWGVEVFRDVSDLGAAALAQCMAADGLDLLVDLKGWTRGHRLEVLALRPAPVQAHWLGFPGTLGAGFIDYALVDAVVAPPGCEAGYSEALVRLPRYQPTDSQRPLAPPLSRAEVGLPVEALVLACFCQPQKLNPGVLALWLRLLVALPDAVLWLLAMAPEAEAALRAAASAAGVAPARLVFAPQQPQAKHLARYALADLALDTWPYGSHTTASDALWAGCPQLALLGLHFPGRVAASVLHAAGLADCITDSEAEHEAMILRLGRDPAARAALRQRVAAARGSALFDTPGFLHGLEAAYAAMHARAEAGLPPAAMSFG